MLTFKLMILYFIYFENTWSSIKIETYNGTVYPQ
jgi:hypothetical protein